MVGDRILLVFKAGQGILTKLGRFETPTRGLETTYPLNVIGQCLGTPKFEGEKDD